MKYEKTKEVLNQLVADLSQLVMVVHQTGQVQNVGVN